MTGGWAAIKTLRDRLNRICVDSLDVEPVKDGLPALERQTHEMGQVSGWFADVNAALARVEAALDAADEMYRKAGCLQEGDAWRKLAAALRAVSGES